MVDPTIVELLAASSVTSRFLTFKVGTTAASTVTGIFVFTTVVFDWSAHLTLALFLVWFIGTTLTYKLALTASITETDQFTTKASKALVTVITV